MENVSDALLLLKNIFWLKDTIMYIGKNNDLSVNWEMKVQTIVVEDTIEGKISYDLVVVKTRKHMKYFQASSFLPAGDYPWLKVQDRFNKTTYTEKIIH